MFAELQLESGCELVSVMMEERKNQGELKTLKALSASVLLVEAVVGALVPMAIGHYDKMEKWISWLNCFTGGVLIATGTLQTLTGNLSGIISRQSCTVDRLWNTQHIDKRITMRTLPSYLRRSTG